MSRSTHSKTKQPRRHNTPHRSARTTFRSAVALGNFDALATWEPARLTRRVVN